MFAFWLTCGYYNILSNKSQKKLGKKALFLVILSAAEGPQFRLADRNIAVNDFEFPILSSPL